MDREECRLSVDGWLSWAERVGSELAIIDTSVDYAKLAGAKTRNMVTRALRREYDARPFVYNEHLHAIHEINVSMPERQGQPMSAGYLVKPTPSSPFPLCGRHTVEYVGVFDRSGDLRAYCQLYICGELAIINRILGHGDYLKDGVMNLLVCYLVGFANGCGAKALNYLTMSGGRSGINAFKRHAGFRPMTVELAS